MLASNRPRLRRRLAVETLWGRTSHRRCWGGGVPSPARLLARLGLGRLVTATTDADVSFVDTVVDHQARIANVLRAWRRGVFFDPLVIGPDGNLWDGMHRLAGLYLAETPEVDVVDFSEASHLVARACLPESVFGRPFRRGTAADVLCRRFAAALPYRHLFVPEVLDPGVATQIRQQFETLPWRLSSTEFYDQHEVSLLDTDHPLEGTKLGALREVVFGASFLRLVAEITALGPLRVSDIACHRSCPGQQIGLHNDFSLDAEVCRLTIHFNPRWSLDEGGLFVTFAGPTSETATAAYVPSMNSAVLFEVSPASYHAVTPVAGTRDRYSLVISLVQEEM